MVIMPRGPTVSNYAKRQYLSIKCYGGGGEDAWVLVKIKQNPYDKNGKPTLGPKLQTCCFDS